VVEHLRKAGLSIIATNLPVGRLELDIVAREGRVIVVVEVRARSDAAWTSAFGSLDSKKRARVRRAAERIWRQRYRDDASVDRLRIDAASVTFADGEPAIEYVKAAF
jgi:putative endonuclease